MFGGRLNLDVVRPVVNGLLISVGGPDHAFINAHPHVGRFGVQNVVGHVSKVASSELEVSESGSSVSCDNVNGRLSHSCLALLSPTSLVLVVLSGPYGSTPSVGTLESSSASDEHGRDK
jgi:hypothetical protein